MIHEKNHRIGGGYLFRGRIDPKYVQVHVVTVRDVAFSAPGIGTEADEKFGDTRRGELRRSVALNL
ncbi:hypothetical protein ACFWPD_10150 [Streptomyces bauhiniae]